MGNSCSNCRDKVGADTRDCSPNIHHSTCPDLPQQKAKDNYTAYRRTCRRGYTVGGSYRCIWVVIPVFLFETYKPPWPFGHVPVNNTPRRNIPEQRHREPPTPGEIVASTVQIKPRALSFISSWSSTRIAACLTSPFAVSSRTGASR